jgi:hypothetical protein
MHLDTDAYLAVGGLVGILIVTVGLLAFLFMQKR